MLAELENSRERQAERDAATAREAKLQALTISRQRNLNRVLIVLSMFLAMAVFAGALFVRFRERVMRKLEIKTREAASAEKLKTEFLGMISHELRTPLNGIIGISDFLANYHSDEDIRHKTGIILSSGNELLSVVESLTDMARIDAGQLRLVPHDTDLGLGLSEVPEIWTESAASKALTFTHFIDPAISRYHVDEDRIIQCVNILLANAMSFTDSGRVHLHVTLSKTDPVELSVVVADTGQGMSELVQSRLFTPFMQADASRKRTHMGTGLNLAIAYALVELMGGKLSCVSRTGRGSEFTFNIPLPEAVSKAPEMSIEALLGDRTEDSMAEVTPVHETKQQAVTPLPILDTPILEAPILDRPDAPRREFVDLMQPDTGRIGLHDTETHKSAPQKSAAFDVQQKILIVDDMVSNRDVLHLILESKGHYCAGAADGYAALAALERQSFDLVILDIHMAPLDGIQTLKRLRASGKSYADISVIALTADNAPSTNAECMEAGADLFLAKPILREELLRAISFVRKTESARILSQRA